MWEDREGVILSIRLLTPMAVSTNDALIKSLHLKVLLITSSMIYSI